MWSPDEISAERLLQVVLMSPVFLFALTIHEYAHAWMAKQFGDRTAEEQGRLTLNPIAHIDPTGLLVFLLSCYAGIGFGWAKPVPVRLANCREPLKAMFWVAIAGPLSNLLQALVAILVLVFLGLLGAPSASAVASGIDPIFTESGLSLPAVLACITGYYLTINLILMFFNLVPIPPLDGGRVLVSLAPYKIARFAASLEQYGFMILFAMMFLGVFQYLFIPLIYVMAGIVIVFHLLGFG